MCESVSVDIYSLILYYAVIASTDHTITWVVMKRRAAADANKIFAATCFAEVAEDAKAELAATTGVEIFAISVAAVAESARCLVDDACDKPPLVDDADAILVALTDENDDETDNADDDNDDLTAAPVAPAAVGVCQKSAAA